MTGADDHMAKKLTDTICLTIALLFGSVGMSWSANKKDAQFQTIEFKDGVDAEGSRAIAESLGRHITSSFNSYLTDTHFPFGPRCSSNDAEPCRQNLKYALEFKTASIDLDDDGRSELIVELRGPNECGSGGCTSYILKEYPDGWRQIGSIFGGGDRIKVSRAFENGFRTIKWNGKSGAVYQCIFKGGQYACPWTVVKKGGSQNGTVLVPFGGDAARAGEGVELEVQRDAQVAQVQKTEQVAPALQKPDADHIEFDELIKLYMQPAEDLGIIQSWGTGSEPGTPISWEHAGINSPMTKSCAG